MAESKTEVIVPPMLEDMCKRVSGADRADVSERERENLRYIGGWIFGAAQKEYGSLLEREGLPGNPAVIKLLCEIAALRGLVRWHEIRDRPPPMPSIVRF
jgi:hypothetical protein